MDAFSDVGCVGRSQRDPIGEGPFVVVVAMAEEVYFTKSTDFNDEKGTESGLCLIERRYYKLTMRIEDSIYIDAAAFEESWRRHYLPLKGNISNYQMLY